MQVQICIIFPNKEKAHEMAHHPMKVKNTNKHFIFPKKHSKKIYIAYEHIIFPKIAKRTQNHI
jgi:hypothetical protein